MRECTTLQKKRNNTSRDKETKKGNKRRIDKAGGGERNQVRGE